MSWVIVFLSILSAVLVLALLIFMDGHKPQPVCASRQPKSAGRNGQAGESIHSGQRRRIPQVFSMF